MKIAHGLRILLVVCLIAVLTFVLWTSLSPKAGANPEASPTSLIESSAAATNTLSAPTTTPSKGTLNAPTATLSAVDQALLATLTSHLKWQTLQGSADVVWYKPDGGTQVFTNAFSIQQPNLAYIDVKSVDGTGVGGGWWSDGSLVYSAHPITGEFAGRPLPGFSNDFSKLPATLEEAKSTTAIYRHPFGMLIPSPVGEYLYPQWFSQGGGTYEFVGEDAVLGRKAWVIEYAKLNSETTAWIDQETGVILKYTQKVDGKLFVEVIFTRFEVDSSIDPSVFAPPEDATPEAE